MWYIERRRLTLKTEDSRKEVFMKKLKKLFRPTIGALACVALAILHYSKILDFSSVPMSIIFYFTFGYFLISIVVVFCLKE